MTDKEIIKALECCCSNKADNCNECLMCDFGNCQDILITNCANLIRKQQATIERLKKEGEFTTLKKCWYRYYTGEQGKRKHFEMKLVCTECQCVWDIQGYAFSYCPNCGRKVVDD